MFEADLKQRFERIFGIPKVTFSAPGESEEQGCLFVDIQSASSAVKKGRQIARVVGAISIFARSEKIPFGYFTKKINAASLELVSGLFFHNVDETSKRSQDIVERKCSFVFLYSGEYDPKVGSLTSVELSEATS